MSGVAMFASALLMPGIVLFSTSEPLRGLTRLARRVPCHQEGQIGQFGACRDRFGLKFTAENVDMRIATRTKSARSDLVGSTGKVST